MKRAAVTETLSELTGWSVQQSEQTMEGTAGSPLQQLADDRIRALDRPSGQAVLIHGDPWKGNMLWDGDTCGALIDWKSSGVGDPGIDLGHLRLQ